MIKLESCPCCGAAGQHSFSGVDLMFPNEESYDYAECESCQAVYLTPMPDSTAIQSFYPSEYSVYKPLKSKVAKISFAERAVLSSRYNYSHLGGGALNALIGRLLGMFKYTDSVPFVDRGVALDVGCGNGKYIQKLNVLGWDAQGVDFSQDAVNACLEADINARCGSLVEAGFPDNYFDLISIRHVVEHLDDPKALLTEASRILKPGGSLLIRTPNCLAAGRKIFPECWYADDVPRHTVLFSPQTLDGICSKLGLKNSTLKYYTSAKNYLKSYAYRFPGKAGKSFMLRLASKLYVLKSRLSNSGDEIFAVYKK